MNISNKGKSYVVTKKPKIRNRTHKEIKGMALCGRSSIFHTDFSKDLDEINCSYCLKIMGLK